MNRNGALRTQQPVRHNHTQRLMIRLDCKYAMERVRQVGTGPHIIDDFSNCPKRRDHDILAVHQPARAVFEIAKRLLYHYAVADGHTVQ